MKPLHRNEYVAALITVASLAGCVPNVDPAVSSWPAGEPVMVKVDDGVGSPGGVRMVRFQLAPLQTADLIDTTSSCSCSALRFATNQIQIGQPFVGEAEIKVSQKVGDYSIKIQFKTTPEFALPPLEITYHSRSGLYALPANFDLGQVVEASAVERTLQIENWDAKEIEELQVEVEGVENAEAIVSATQPTDYDWGKPLQTWLATVHFTPLGQAVPNKPQVCRIRLQDPAGQLLAEVPMRFEVAAAVRLSPDILYFGDIPSGKQVTRTGYVVFNRDLKFVSPSQLDIEEVEGIAVDVDTSNPHLLQIKVGIEGDGSGTHLDRVIQVRVDEPAPRELSLRVVGEHLAGSEE